MPAKNPLLDYLNAIYRYPLVAVCTLLVGVILTGWTVRSLPNIYSSTTLIMVEPQDVPQAFVPSTVTTKLEERLNALNQEVLSRTRLQAIINDFDLFHDLRKQGVPDETVVDMMRKRIQVQVYSRDNAFRITYEGYDPRIVQQVTARLAGMYIDENLKVREEHVAGTADFLKNELDKMRQRLEEQDTRIQSFKQANMGQLPEQRDSNMQALEGLRLQLQTVSLALSAAKERKVLLERQVAGGREAATAGGPGHAASALDPQTRLQQLQADLVDLRSRYTAHHPDVIRAEHQISELKAELAKKQDDGSGALDALVPPDLARAVSEVNFEIARLQGQTDKIEKAIEVYQKRIEESFPSERQLQDLTRDYGVIQKQYQSMLDKKLDAQLSQSLEQRQKAERFRVLDPASLPEAPTRPNRLMLALVGIGGSLALALGLPILLWQIDSSFHDADELTGSAVPVLAVIPQVPTSNVLRRLRRYRVRVIGFSAAGLVVGFGAVVLYARFLF